MAGRKGERKREGHGHNPDAYAPENYPLIKDRLLQQCIDQAREAAAGDNAAFEERTRCALIAHLVYETLGRLYRPEDIKVILDAADRAAAVLEVPRRPQTWEAFEAMQWAIFTEGEEPLTLDDDAPRRMGMPPR